MKELSGITVTCCLSYLGMSYESTIDWFDFRPQEDFLIIRDETDSGATGI
jgi:hypothetical protein